jgi:prostatic aicd phosphatase
LLILNLQKEYGLKLPKWTENYYPKKLVSLTDQSYIYNAYNNELKRLKGGVFVKKAIGDWDKKVDKKLETKIFLYGGHDSTVTNILSALNVWEKQFPGYAITAMIEFSKHKQTGEYGVEIFLRNSTEAQPYPLTIPGCFQFCPWQDVKKLLKNTIPEDWEEECKAKNEDFTEPTIGGP